MVQILGPMVIGSSCKGCRAFTILQWFRHNGKSKHAANANGCFWGWDWGTTHSTFWQVGKKRRECMGEEGQKAELPRQPSSHDPDVIWTRNLLIWSQTRYRCATESYYPPRVHSTHLHQLTFHSASKKQTSILMVAAGLEWFHLKLNWNNSFLLHSIEQ